MGAGIRKACRTGLVLPCCTRIKTSLNKWFESFQGGAHSPGGGAGMVLSNKLTFSYAVLKSQSFGRPLDSPFCLSQGF